MSMGLGFLMFAVGGAFFLSTVGEVADPATQHALVSLALAVMGLVVWVGTAIEHKIPKRGE